jgi:hypothetical protein
MKCKFLQYYNYNNNIPNHDEKQNNYKNVLHLCSCMVVNLEKNTTKKNIEQENE